MVFDVSKIEDISIDISTMTIGEIEDIEDELDADFAAIFDGSAGVRQGKLMRVMAFVALKREHPDITPEDARNIPIEVFNKMVVVEDGEEIRPT